MNKMLGSTQFHVPSTSTLEQAYNVSFYANLFSEKKLISVSLLEY